MNEQSVVLLSLMKGITLFFPKLCASAEGLEVAVTGPSLSLQKLEISRLPFPSIHFDYKVSVVVQPICQVLQKRNDFSIVSKLGIASVNL